MVIQDIQEVSQYIEVKFEVSLQWRDARVVFYNIKQDEEMNTLTMDEQLSLWSPTLVFWNTKQQLRTLNDKNSFPLSDRKAMDLLLGKRLMKTSWCSEEVRTVSYCLESTVFSLIVNITWLGTLLISRLVILN